MKQKKAKRTEIEKWDSVFNMNVHLLLSEWYIARTGQLATDWIQKARRLCFSLYSCVLGLHSFQKKKSDAIALVNLIDGQITMGGTFIASHVDEHWSIINLFIVSTCFTSLLAVQTPDRVCEHMTCHWMLSRRLSLTICWFFFYNFDNFNLFFWQFWQFLKLFDNFDRFWKCW